MAALQKALVREQFDQQVAHYLASSAMADRMVIEAIVAAAPVQPGQRVLDVACGAGFLLLAYRDAGADVVGVDLSSAMLREAGNTLGLSPGSDQLILADASSLPFDSETFDAVTCKLAFHYFSDPRRVVQEKVRVCQKQGLVALIDRVACDDPKLCAAQNRLEKLRTPNKVRVYDERELTALLTSAGLTILRRELVIQTMGFEEWMTAAGAEDRMRDGKDLLIGAEREDLTGLAPREESGRLVIHHRTLILVAKPTSLQRVAGSHAVRGR
jgi:ubiquinone/menaquinone biosynthesis C-methylase UbiE